MSKWCNPIRNPVPITTAPIFWGLEGIGMLQIGCFHFLLSDRKELVHDNQLSRIGRRVERERDHVQFIAPILSDKLPANLNKDQYIILKLSPADKLFRIESH